MPGNSPHIALHGLENINLDLWTAFLAQGRTSGASIQSLATALQTSLRHASTEVQVFEAVRSAANSIALQSSENYHDLGLALLGARQDLRFNNALPSNALRDSLFLLQMMAEEVLYVGSKKFAAFPATVRLNRNVSLDGKAAPIKDFQVQTGDVIVSKSTGSGSSSLIALTMDHPHVYSHSTPVYVDSNGQALSPEAFIEDGVKLRDMTKEYTNGSKTRMSVYRYQGDDTSLYRKVDGGMQSLIAEMNQRTSGDPYNKAAFPYDFSMTPGEIQTRGMFCSSVAHEVYSRAGVSPTANPYSAAVWSRISQGRRLLLNSIAIQSSRVPAPGDIELNKNFVLVAAHLDVTKLRNERIEMAIIDTFLREVETNKGLMERINESLKVVSSKPVDKQSLRALAASGLLPQEVAAHAASIDKIPDSINIKQLVFFALMNEVITPKLRESILLQLSQSEKSGHITGLIELRHIARAHGQMMLKEMERFEQKITAATGIMICRKIWQ